MVQILPSEDYWGDAFRQAGSGFAKGYMNQSDENALQKSISSLGPNASARDILNAITNTKTYSPESKQQVLKNYLGVAEFEELQRKAKAHEVVEKARLDIEKAKQERETNKAIEERPNVRNIVSQLDIPEEKKGPLAESLSQDAAESLLKEQFKGGEGKLTPFQKKLQEKNAEEYIKLTNDISNLESLEGDINYADDLSKELGEGLISGPVGMATSKTGLSETGKKLENVSFTMMQPIVKIFNPSGPIAQQKLKMIQDKFVIQPGDAPWTRRAKIDAIRRFTKQALNRARQKIDLIKRYDGNPPEGEMKEFDRVSDTLSDAMLDYDLTGEEAKAPDLPDAAQFKGKTITSPEGIKYHSDGTRWVKR